MYGKYFTTNDVERDSYKSDAATAAIGNAATAAKKRVDINEGYKQEADRIAQEKANEASRIAQEKADEASRIAQEKADKASRIAQADLQFKNRIIKAEAADAAATRKAEISAAASAAANQQVTGIFNTVLNNNVAMKYIESKQNIKLLDYLEKKYDEYKTKQNGKNNLDEIYNTLEADKNLSLELERGSDKYFSLIERFIPHQTQQPNFNYTYYEDPVKRKYQNVTFTNPKEYQNSGGTKRRNKNHKRKTLRKRRKTNRS
jgi:hypothetical protein